ncbi:MAG: hypothetical protein A2516_09950 [Alphaproteobacteria bacterium RIFOXYD12_FULL_60_8]|nr:MAG: hypothetical protein A2516_09950 [Alphaproteobacteria bacterium RIFOXYD12_FULL_60_8]
MNADAPSKELVGLIHNRAKLEAAIIGLRKAGFARTEISLLTSHDSVDAAGKEDKSLKEMLLPLLDEIRYEEPLVDAGLIALSAGPVGAALAGLVAAGVGGLALRELLDEMTSLPDSERVATALQEGGVLIWVAVSNAKSEASAREILAAQGATDIHLETRP